MTQFNSVKPFINKLMYLENQGKDNFYRGITDAQYPSVPKAFRDSYIKDFAARFPHSATDVDKWILNAIKNIRNHPNQALASAAPDNYLHHLCNLLLINLRYNHALYQEYQEKGFPKNCNDEKLINIFKHGENGHWAEEKTFYDYIDRFYIAIVSLVRQDGHIVKEACVMEDTTGLDETFPQHYDMATSALDVTSDPFISLFFTTYHDKSASYTRYLSITVLREINKIKSPIIVKEKDALKENKRAISQKGSFCYFAYPCSFFLQHGRFPSIEDYHYSFLNRSNYYFEMEKIYLLRTKENIAYIQDLLKEKNINEEELNLC